MLGRPMFIFLIMGLYFVCFFIVFLVFEIHQVPENISHDFINFNTCKNPNTFHKKLRHFADISPLYEVFSLNTTSTGQIDNICYTFFQLDKISYIIFKSIVYSNGTGDVTLLFESEIPERPGVFRAASKAENNFDICSYEEYLIGRYNCSENVHQSIYYFYTCFVHGGCKYMHAPQDVRHALSDTPPLQLSKTCHKLAMTDLKLKTLDFQGRVYTVHPNKLHKRCVISYNGAVAINAHKVDLEDQIVYP